MKLTSYALIFFKITLFYVSAEWWYFCFLLVELFVQRNTESVIISTWKVCYQKTLEGIKERKKMGRSRKGGPYAANFRVKA